MSNNRNINWEIDDEDEDDDFIPQNQEDSRLVRDFRKQLNAEKRKNKELQESINSLQSFQKERIIKDVLTSRGVPAEIAELIPANIEASPEAISSWIESKSHLFNGVQKQETQQPAVDQNDIAAMQRINNSTTNAGTPSYEETLASQIAGFTGDSTDDFMSILSGH